MEVTSKASKLFKVEDGTGLVRLICVSTEFSLSDNDSDDYNVSTYVKSRMVLQEPVKVTAIDVGEFVLSEQGTQSAYSTDGRHVRIANGTMEINI